MMKKLGKKVCMALLSAAVCLTGLSGAAGRVCAAEEQTESETKGEYWEEEGYGEDGPWGYVLEDDGTALLTEYYREGPAVVEIPTEVDGYTVTGVLGQAFLEGKRITTLILPETVTWASNDRFAHMPKLEKFVVKEGNPAYRSEDGVLYEKDMKTLAWCPNGKKGTLTIPEGVETLQMYSFLGSSLSEVNLPESLQEIKWEAFAWNDNLTRLVLPGGIEEIGEDAFFECESLQEVVFSEGIKTTGEGMFSSCTKLEQIYLPESLEHIEKGTFFWCKSLKEIVIPKNVTSIGREAFSGCDNLETIRIPDSVKRIGTKAFSGSKKVVIECSENSYARKCAQKRGIPYRIINSTSGSKLGLMVNGQKVKSAQILKVRVKKSYTLQAVRGSEKTAVEWNTSNPKVAAVKNGKVTVKKAGKATITATDPNGKKASVTLSAAKAAVKVTKVQVVGSKTMKKGGRQALNLTVTPASADNAKVSWKSSNTKVVTVDKNGKVTAKKKGTAVITATAKDGSKKKGSIKITVR